MCPGVLFGFFGLILCQTTFVFNHSYKYFGLLICTGFVVLDTEICFQFIFVKKLNLCQSGWRAFVNSNFSNFSKVLKINKTKTIYLVCVLLISSAKVNCSSLKSFEGSKTFSFMIILYLASSFPHQHLPS